MWETLDNVFTKRTQIFRSFYFSDEKTTTEKPVQKIYGCLQELSLNCELDGHRELTIRDVFISNLQNSKNLTQTPKEARTPPKTALEHAINVEMSLQNQVKKTHGASYNCERSNRVLKKLMETNFIFLQLLATVKI